MIAGHKKCDNDYNLQLSQYLVRNPPWPPTEGAVDIKAYTFYLVSQFDRRLFRRKRKKPYYELILNNCNM